MFTVEHKNDGFHLLENGKDLGLLTNAPTKEIAEAMAEDRNTRYGYTETYHTYKRYKKDNRRKS